MTHNETTATLIDRLGWPQTKVNELLQATAEAMGEHLSEPGTLSLPGVGRLISRKQREYISLNPETGERTLMPPAVELDFRLSLNKEKIDLAHIVSLLRKKHPEIGEEDAGRLLSEWITLVRESILRDESIEIPHLGTFQCKQLSDSSNDEERFLITFNPSEKLHRGVNSYFAHFEPTLLNEGVTFDELTTVTSGATTNEPFADNIVTRPLTSPVMVEQTAEPVMEEPNTAEPITAEPVVKEAPLEEAPLPEEPLQNKPAPPPGHIPLRGQPVEKQRKRSSIWVPIIGGVAIVVAGLFFFHRDTTEK